MTRLNGENIYVKLVEESDSESLLSLEANNREFFQQFTGAREESFYTLQGQVDRIKEEIEMKEADRGYLFVICLPHSEQAIGQVFLTEVVRYNLQSCWIGYFLDQEHNGKGYMTEAVKLVVDYAFNQLDLHRIEAGVMLHNQGSMKVLLKSGFHKEGIARKNVKINGRWEDHQTLAIVRDEPSDNDMVKNKQVQRINPATLVPPIGPYTHLTVVPKGADLLVLSGQVGTDLEGNIPSDLNQQLYNTFQNILRVLQSQSVPVENIFKVNIWATEEINWEFFGEAWEKFHGGATPAMTFCYIPALAVESLKIEIEVWAAKY